jgi:hypothetical protein
MPHKLIRVFDAPRTGERESEFSPKGVDAAHPSIEKCIHATRPDPIVTKLIFHVVLQSGG